MKNRLCHFLICSALLSVVFLLTARVEYAAGSITHQISLPAGDSWCDDSMINGLFDQINAYRSAYGRPPLRMDSLGMKDAEIRATQFSAYMATNPPGSPGFNPHQGYDTTAASLGYNIVSENLAYMTTSPGYIVYAAWQDSLHIAAMLASDANVAGVSCIYANGTAYWTYEPACSPDFCGQPYAPSIPGLDSEEWAFLTLINNYRAQNGASALQVSVTLEKSSQWMSNDMATNNYASHTDSLGRDVYTRLAAFGYAYSPWGENIAGGFSDAQNTFNQWATACDPDGSGNCTYAHRQNMLSANFRVIGIGRAYNGNSSYGWYWTTDFGGYVDQVINPNSTPAIASFTANPSTITPGQPTTLSWSVSGASSISLDNGVGDVSNLTSKTVSPTQTTTYTLTAANSAGSATARTTVTVNSVVVTSPANNQTVSGTITISVSAADNVASVQFKLDGENLGPEETSSPYSLSWDTTGTANGSHLLTAVARDAAGNTTTSSERLCRGVQ